MTNEQLMQRAILLSENSVRHGGGPFGAVIAKDGVIVAEASTSVTIDQEPTALLGASRPYLLCQQSSGCSEDWFR